MADPLVLAKCPESLVAAGQANGWTTAAVLTTILVTCIKLKQSVTYADRTPSSQQQRLVRKGASPATSTARLDRNTGEAYSISQRPKLNNRFTRVD